MRRGGPRRLPTTAAQMHAGRRSSSFAWPTPGHRVHPATVPTGSRSRLARGSSRDSRLRPGHGLMQSFSGAGGTAWSKSSAPASRSKCTAPGATTIGGSTSAECARRPDSARSGLRRSSELPQGAMKMLDIGGSHGLFSVALCRRIPGSLGGPRSAFCGRSDRPTPRGGGHGRPGGHQAGDVRPSTWDRPGRRIRRSASAPLRRRDEPGTAAARAEERCAREGSTSSATCAAGLTERRHRMDPTTDTRTPSVREAGAGRAARSSEGRWPGPRFGVTVLQFARIHDTPLDIRVR